MVQLEIKNSINYILKRVQISLMNLTEYREDMFMIFIGTYGFTFVSLIFINALVTNFEQIAGYTRYELILIFGTTQLIYYFFVSFFSGLSDDFPDQILTGEVDKIFLKPINNIVSISFQKIDFIEVLPSTLLGLGIVIYSLINLPPISFFNYILYIFFLIICFILLLLVAFCLSCLTFWISDTTFFEEVFYGLYGEYSKYPPMIYPTNFRFLLMTFIPIGIVSFVPSNLLLRGWSTEYLGFLCFSLVFFLVSAIVLWRLGKRTYSGASS